MSARRQSGFTLLGFMAGMFAGAFVWSSVRHNYRRDLFSRRPVARFFALTYLGSRPTLETFRLLRDYTRWEQNRFLKRQGQKLLSHVEHRIGGQP